MKGEKEQQTLLGRLDRWAYQGTASVWFDVMWAAITYLACALGLLLGGIPWFPR